MIREIEYVNSRGESVRFGGDDAGNPWHFGVTDIFDIDLEYEELGGRIVGLSSSTRELGLHAVMRRGSLAERDRLVDVLSYDAKTCTPGTLKAGQSYIKVYMKKVEPSGYHYSERSYAADITFESDHPVWVRKHTVTLMADQGRTVGGLDFPYDFPHDYGRSQGTTAIVRNPFMLPVKCDIVFPGPCDNPYVIIGPNRYQVRTTAVKGQLVIVQGFPEDGSRHIVLRDANGTERSILADGVREDGAHVFAEVPVGDNVASWAGAFNIQVTMYEERFAPCWSPS